MRNDPSRPHGPAWRQQPGAGRRNPKAQQDWRQEAAAAPSTSRVWSRRTKMWVGIGTLAGLVAITVVVIFLLRPANPSAWVLLGTHDWDNLDLPLNVEGYNGLVSFSDWAHSDSPSLFWGRNLPHVLHDGPVELKKGAEWFAKVNEERKKETTVVLYFTAPGGADADGPFLFFGDARPDDERKGRLYVTDILSRLEELPKEKNKVLILDATQNGANWPFGQLYNDFTRRLIDLEERIRQVPRLIVINSSGPEQRSWPSDTVRQTFFSFYLCEGMRGQAAPGESLVRAEKLFDYVREHVAQKVRANRLAEQTPILLPEKGGRERAEEIILTRVTGKPYEPADVPPSLNTAAIQKRWARCAELSRRSPPPYVNHPQLWRQYRDGCLRYEQLLRAGEQKAADAFEAKLTSLESRLNVAVPEKAACLENSLAMPAALGVALPRGLDEKVVQGWRRLWRAQTAEERQDRWKELRDMVQAGVQEKVLRLRCGTLLLGELADTADEPARSRAAAMLDLLAADAGPRPAELHFLYMLLKNLHGEPEARTLQLACRTRREAEEAALVLPPASAAGSPAYSERVYPWIQDKIQKADEARRQGEDLLFSSVKEQWQQAESNLNEALDLYQKARAEGREVAQALAWRDRLFAVLPDFSRWLAGRFINPTAPAAKEIEEEVNKVQDLWVRAHRLESLLAKPEPQAIAELTKVTKDVNDKFASLAAGFNHRWKDLLDKAVTQPRWHEVEEILAASWADPDLLPDQEPNQRRVLVENQRSVSETLFRSDSPEQSVKAVKPDGRIAASYQARVAVDALGEHWVDQNRHGADPNYGLLRQRVSSPDPVRWQADLVLPADQIGRLWRQMPKEIKKQADAAREPEAGLEGAGKALADADWLCRLVDGPAVDRLAGDPAADARRLQWHNLFLALGRRTAGDQWYGPTPETLYYRLIGSKYQQEAATLVKALAGRGGPSKALLAAATALQAELDKDSKLELTGPRTGQENITSQSQFELDFRLAGQPGLKPGFAVLGMKAGRAFVPAFERDTQEIQARKIDPAAGAQNIKYVLKLAPGEAGSDEGREREIVVEGFYRGQTPRRVITGQIHAPDTVITFTPRPKNASLAVLSDPAVEEQFAPKNSVLSIVLDCSGSMWAGLTPDPRQGFKSKKDVQKAEEDRQAGKWAGQKRRFDHAVDSLDEVLGSLQDGVTVNVWTFAQLDAKEGDIKKLWGPQRWDASKRAGLMAQVRSLIPCYETPLVKAMSRAKDDFDSKANGFKTLVVLTDGDDNQFFTKECADLRQKHPVPNLTIPKFLQLEFQGSGIRIHMALFDVEKDELENAKKQFGELGKLDPPGEVKVIANAADLVKDLRRVMRFELRYWLYRDGEKPVNENGFPVIYLGKDRQNLAHVSQERQNLFWPRLDPAMYTIRVNNKYPQDVQLNDGDLVIATLRRQGKDVFLDRGLYARDLVNQELGNVDNNEMKKANDWWLSLLRNEQGGNVLQLMMCLEKESPGAAAVGRHTIQQVRPQFVWFEVQGKGVANPKLYWNNFEYFPAPAWSLEVRDWANPEGVTPKPAASVWWSADWDPATGALLDTLHRNPKVAVNEDFATRQAKGYRIKRVTVEEHHINDEVGTKPCLVVRAEYDPKNQILVRLKKMPGVTDQQAQHCYYSKTHDYTGYFWPVPEAALDREFDLEIISVDEFKQKAQDRNTYIKDWNLPPLRNAAPLPITLKPRHEFDD